MLRYLDLRGPHLAEVVAGLADAQPSTFATLVKAVAQGDRALEDQIFRSWGVRRQNPKAALSFDLVWSSDLHAWVDPEAR